MPVHLVKEITRLKKLLLRLCALVEDNLRDAVEAVLTLNRDQAEQVVAKDVDIDRMEIELEEECLKILALYQPVAIDLRYVIACLKMNNDIERVGDMAVNIAERAIAIVELGGGRVPMNLSVMSEKSRAMLHNSITALIEMDTKLAEAVRDQDDEVDALNRRHHLMIDPWTTEHPGQASLFLNYLCVSRHLERVADYSANIAEDVIYMVKGEIVRHSDSREIGRVQGRPSGDGVNC